MIQSFRNKEKLIQIPGIFYCNVRKNYIGWWSLPQWKFSSRQTEKLTSFWEKGSLEQYFAMAHDYWEFMLLFMENISSAVEFSRLYAGSESLIANNNYVYFVNSLR